ncbi:hypothetical protein [Amaricoccus sp.]|uniref:hypothetical protein n=1 Tax=Amaricoccus sp. TaxID=1872485 RepID=UPI001B4AFAA8|nr:hypothetical protein [Amaricoccus sp.]MBP7003559.1 hypothetical protein [Amaricoccus sp.]
MSRLAAALALAILAAAGPASACAICLSAVSVTVGEQIDAADRVVLAAPEGGALRVAAVVKGAGAAGETIPLDTLVPRVGLRPGQALLLAHNAFAGTWTSLGGVDPANAGWLAGLAASDGAARLALAGPRLEDADPLVARIAHDEIARAPYGSLAGLAASLDPATLRAFVAAPGRAEWRPGYILLLGLAGDAADADAIEASLGQGADPADLAALLAADMELRGPGRVPWVEETWLADRSRTLPEIEAALRALSVQGDADATVPRAEVVAAFRRFIRARPPMAGFVAADLGRWQAWDASPDYAALIEAGAVADPAEEFAILSYLQQSPDPAARAALAHD